MKVFAEVFVVKEIKVGELFTLASSYNLGFFMFTKATQADVDYQKNSRCLYLKLIQKPLEKKP